MFTLYQPHFHTLLHDLFEQLLEQFRFLKPSMPAFRERGVMRDLLIEAQAGEPAPRQMHAQFLHQFTFAGDAVFAALNKDSAIIVYERRGFLNTLRATIIDFKDGS